MTPYRKATEAELEHLMEHPHLLGKMHVTPAGIFTDERDPLNLLPAEAKELPFVPSKEARALIINEEAQTIVYLGNEYDLASLAKLMHKPIGAVTEAFRSLQQSFANGSKEAQQFLEEIHKYNQELQKASATRGEAIAGFKLKGMDGQSAILGRPIKITGKGSEWLKQLSARRQQRNRHKQGDTDDGTS